MQRYYFHFVQDGCVLEDPDGSERASVEAAHVEAVRQIRAMIADDVRYSGLIRLSRRIDIAQADGVIARRVAFVEAVTICETPDCLP